MNELATRPADLPTMGAFGVQNGWDGTLERVPSQQVSKGERFREWLDLFIKTEQVANVLAKTTFVPKQMQNKPADVAAAMLRGFEMGIDPLDALAHMHVINGKVGYSAEFMRRRVIQAGHEILFAETTDSRAVVKARRREHRDDDAKWQSFAFTTENAKKAGIDLGGYPADKLVARASSRMCKRMFPEVLAGADIAEDLIDAVVIEGGDTSGVDLDTAPQLAPVRTATARRRRQPVKAEAPKPQAKPDVDDLLDDEPAADAQPAQPAAAAEAQDDDLLGSEDGYDAPDAADEPPITKPQLQKLSILRQREGYGDNDEGRSDWFQWVEVNIARTVGTNKDLTKAEASVLIDILESAQAQDTER